MMEAIQKEQVRLLKEFDKTFNRYCPTQYKKFKSIARKHYIDDKLLAEAYYNVITKLKFKEE